MFPELGAWRVVRDGDLRVLALVRRHYSEARKRKRGGRRQGQCFTGPGEKMVLLTADGRACWAWRKASFRQDGEVGVNCVVFRNEGPLSSVALVAEADTLAWARWPGERLFTFVDPSALPPGSNPGYCFKLAGYTLVRTADGRPKRTGRGMQILECHAP